MDSWLQTDSTKCIILKDKKDSALANLLKLRHEEREAVHRPIIPGGQQTPDGCAD